MFYLFSFFTGGLLVARYYWAGFGWSETFDRYAGLIWLVFYASIVLLVSGFLIAMYELFGVFVLNSYDRKIAWRKLNDLTDAERQILLGFVNNKTKTLALDVTSGVVMGLVESNVIYQASRMGELEYFDFNINEWAWLYIKAHPHILRNGKRKPLARR